MKALKLYLLKILILLFIVMAILASQGYSNSRPKELEKKLLKLISQNDNALEKTKNFIKSYLIHQLSNPIFVANVKAQNARGVTVDEIIRIDTEWKRAKRELPIHVRVMSGKCAAEVRRLVKKLSAVGETFVTDNQGAIVCQNELTEDYWQGDEPKWKNAFNNGEGGVDIGTEKLDRSSNIVLQQVSLPLIDSNEVVIGAITFGVMIDRIR